MALDLILQKQPVAFAFELMIQIPLKTVGFLIRKLSDLLLIFPLRQTHPIFLRQPIAGILEQIEQG